MASKTFNSRLQFRGDTLSAWKAANPVLLKNELAIVTVPADAEAVVQQPAILFKVGDGTKNFEDLPYVSAVAADVHDWAKAASKPDYTASEITGLAEYISGKIQDTDTQYKLEQDTTNGHVLKFMSKALGATDWTTVATITTVDTVYDDTTLAGRVTELETLVGSEGVAEQIGNAITALKLAETYATKTDLKTVSDAIATLNGEGEGSVKKQVADAVAAIVNDAPEAYDTLKEISDWITNHSGSASEMNSKITANQTAITDLTNLIGSLPEGESATTIVEFITSKIDGLGALAAKDKVSKTDLDEALKTELEGKATDASLAAIAKTGNVNDLVQTEGDTVIFNCGNATGWN